MVDLKKIEKLVDEILMSGFIHEDDQSRDYCKYCYRNYGNYSMFSLSNNPVENNHEEDCVYRLAFELNKELPH